MTVSRSISADDPISFLFMAEQNISLCVCVCVCVQASPVAHLVTTYHMWGELGDWDWLLYTIDIRYNIEEQWEPTI